MDDPGLQSRQEQDLFSFPKSSNWMLGPNHTPIQWVPRVTFLGSSSRKALLEAHLNPVQRF